MEQLKLINQQELNSLQSDQNVQQQEGEIEGKRMERQLNGIWYNEKGQKICGHFDSQTRKICRNPLQCRIHNPQQKCYVMRDRSSQKKLISGKWKQDEHIRFLKCVRAKGIGRWQEVSNMLGSRSPSQCQVHYFKLKEKLGLNDDQMHQHLMMEDYGFENIQPNNKKKPLKNVLKTQQVRTKCKHKNKQTIILKQDVIFFLYNILLYNFLQYSSLLTASQYFTLE